MSNKTLALLKKQHSAASKALNAFNKAADNIEATLSNVVDQLDAALAAASDAPTAKAAKPAKTAKVAKAAKVVKVAKTAKVAKAAKTTKVAKAAKPAKVVKVAKTAKVVKKAGPAKKVAKVKAPLLKKGKLKSKPVAADDDSDE